MKLIYEKLREEVFNYSLAQDRFEKSIKKTIDSVRYEETIQNRETKYLLFCLTDLLDMIHFQTEEFAEYGGATMEAEQELARKKAEEETDLFLH